MWFKFKYKNLSKVSTANAELNTTITYKDNDKDSNDATEANANDAATGVNVDAHDAGDVVIDANSPSD